MQNNERVINAYEEETRENDSKVESFRGTSLYASFLICTYALAKAASNSCIAFLIFQMLYTMPHATRLPRLGEEQY